MIGALEIIALTILLLLQVIIIGLDPWMCTWEDKMWSTHFRRVGEEVRRQGQPCAFRDLGGGSVDEARRRTGAAPALWLLGIMVKASLTWNRLTAQFSSVLCSWWCLSEGNHWLVLPSLTQAHPVGSAGADTPSVLPLSLLVLFPPPPPPPCPSIGAPKQWPCCPLWFGLGLWGNEPLSLLYSKASIWFWSFVGRCWGKHLCLGPGGSSVVCYTDYSPKHRDHKEFYFGLEAGALKWKGLSLKFTFLCVS